MALFRVANERAQFDAASNDARDQYGAGIRFTQEGNARVTTSAGTFYNQGIPMSGTGQVAIVDATAGLPSGTIYHNGLPMSGDKVCVSKNATAVVSNGLPFDSAGALAADINFDLNFIGTDTLNSSVTFTRASTATYFNSAGVLTSAAINEARFDYNPATLAARGLLIEEQRTNLFQRSEEFNDAYWNLVVSASVTANATTAPNSTVTADKIVEAAASSVHYLGRNNVLLAAATTCSVSVFAKASERSFIGLQLTPDGTNYIYCTFNLATGVASTPVNAGNGSGATAAISAVGNGWYRCTLSGVPSSTAANPVAAFYVGNANVNLVTSPYLGDGTSGIFLWGAQLEAGAFPTSYIPTTTTALTRSADVASVNTLSPWFNATEGTFVLRGNYSYIAAGTPGFARMDNNSDNERYMLAITSGTHRFTVVTGGSEVVDISRPGVVAGTPFTQAGAYKVDDFAACINGGTVATDGAGALPTVTRLIFRRDSTSSYPNGHIQRLTYYPRRLSNAELQAITTP